MLVPIDPKTGSWREADHSSDAGLRLLAAGDFCPRVDTVPGERCVTAAGAGEILAGVIDALRDKDVSVINLECPLDSAGEATVKDGPPLRGKPEAVEFLRAGGFDVACLANNHMRDFGVEPMRATQRRLDEAGLAHFGVIDSLADVGRPLTLTVGGRKLAMLTFAEHEFNLAERGAPGVEPLAPGPNAVAIARARAEADLLIVFVHGGSEFCPFPSPRTVRDYRSFIDAGADAVIAHHAHTPQPMEFHDGKPILYNLGNFLFYDRGADHTPYWLSSYFARLHFAGRRCRGIDLHPFDVDPATGGMTLRDAARRETFIARLNRLGEIVADGELHERFWQAYCLTRIDFYRRGMTEANAALDAGDDRRYQASRLRNMFSCQSHRDVIWTALELIRTGRDAECFGVEGELKELMTREV